MDSDNSAQNADEATAVTCAAPAALTARLPGLLSFATAPAALLINPIFFGLAGVLLACISLLLSSPRDRGLGKAGLIAALVGGIAGVLRLH